MTMKIGTASSGDGELGDMHHLETKHDEVASDMRREQSKQRNEANDVDESADERQGRRSEHDPANRFPGNTGLFMIAPGRTSRC